MLCQENVLSSSKFQHNNKLRKKENQISYDVIMDLAKRLNQKSYTISCEKDIEWHIIKSMLSISTYRYMFLEHTMSKMYDFKHTNKPSARVSFL